MDPRIENLKSTTFFGKRLTRRQIADIQETVALFPGLSRRELSNTICEHLGWFTPKGGYRVQSCLGMLEQLEALGILSLPETRVSMQRGSRKKPVWTHRSDPVPTIGDDLKRLTPLVLQVGDGEGRGGGVERVGRPASLPGQPASVRPAPALRHPGQPETETRMPDVRSGDDGAALPRPMDRLAGTGPREVAEPGGQQFKVHDFPLGQGQVSGIQGAVGRAPTACRRLGGAARLPAGAGGDVRRFGEVRSDLLPRGQLAEDRHDEGTQGECGGGRQDTEGRLRLPPGAELQIDIAERAAAGQAPVQAAVAELHPGRPVRATLERHHRNSSRCRQRPRPGLGSSAGGC